MVETDGAAMGLDDIRREIEHMRSQIRGSGRKSSSFTVPGYTLTAEALSARMQASVDNLCAQRDKLIGEKRLKYPGTGKVIKGTPATRRLQDTIAIFTKPMGATQAEAKAVLEDGVVDARKMSAYKFWGLVAS
jgi:hypothetical protein